MTMIVTPCSLSLNGLSTGGCDPLVKNKIARAIRSRNAWSSSENSNTNNAWYASFPGGSVANNDKNNAYAVRPFVELEDDYLASWIEAFMDCAKRKKNSKAFDDYRPLCEEDIVRLATACYTRTYQPLPSIRFGVKYPRPREVFAAQFRDRIVHHWIYLRVVELIETRYQQMGDVSMNCRKGFGPQLAVKTLAGFIEEVSEGYTRETWIGKFDLKACFMSVDVKLLISLIESELLADYQGDDKALLVWLIGVTLRNRPQEGAITRGDPMLLEAIPSNKILRGENGVPIGNLPSQIFVNYLLTYLDEFILDYLSEHEPQAHYLRFADDFVVVCRDKETVKAVRRLAAEFLRERLKLTLHPDKVYIQEARHGVRFLGSVIRPGRVYADEAAVRALGRSLERLERACQRGCSTDELERRVSSVNSYLGMMSHAKSYAIRRRMLSEKVHLWRYCYVVKKFLILKIKKCYVRDYRDELEQKVTPA